jgi:hypothetical protein
MSLMDILSWSGVAISASTSIIRASNIGYQQYTYIMSALSCLLLMYNAYELKSKQLMILNSFHLIINLIGIYRWKKNKN